MDVIIKTFADVIAYKPVEAPADKEIKTLYDNNGDFVEINAIVLRIGTQSELSSSLGIYPISLSDRSLSYCPSFNVSNKYLLSPIL